MCVYVTHTGRKKCREAERMGEHECSKHLYYIGKSPWAGKFRVRGWVCQPYPVTGRDWGMLGEPGGQLHSDMLNRHLCHSSCNNIASLKINSY